AARHAAAGGAVRPPVGQQIEGVVGDAGREVHVHAGPVARVVVHAAAVGGRVAHRAQPVGLEGALADGPVRLHVGVLLGGVPLHAGAHDVTEGLVQAARLAGVDQPGGALGQAVGDLVAGDVQGGERGDAAVAVAVVHLPPVPLGVHPVVAEVDVVHQL